MERMSQPFSILLLIGFLAMSMGWLLSLPSCAIAELSDQQAIAIANKEMAKFDVDPAGWVIRLDKDSHDWQRTRESWERWIETAGKGRAADTKARIGVIEGAMKGKDIWLVVYNRAIPPGKHVLHNHAIVFLDSRTGKVLSVINPEE